MVLRRFALCQLLFLLCSVPHLSSAQEAGGPDLSQILPIDPKVIIGTLENGLRYYIRANDQPQNRAEFRLVVNAGSVLEDDDQQGLAHFVEHMAFEGTTNFPGNELDGYLQSIGMQVGPDINAYTSFDETVYLLQVPTQADTVLDRTFLILSDWAQNVTFNAEDIEDERPIVIEEWRLGQNAAGRVDDEIFHTLLQGSRYADRLPIGQKAVLDTFPHDALKRFYRDWYRPDLMGIVAVGDFDTARIEALIREHFSGLSVSETAPERPVFAGPEFEGTRFAIASHPEIPFTDVSVGYSRNRRDAQTLGDYRGILIDILFINMIGRRLEALTASQPPPFIFGLSSPTQFVRPVETYLMAALVVPNGVDAGFEALLTEAERAHRFGFGPSELEREKSALLSLFEQLFNERDNTDSDGLAGEYVQHFLSRQPIPGIEYEYDLARTLIPEITLSDVNAAARARLTDDNRVVLIRSQEGPGIQVPSEADLQAVIARVGQKEILPPDDVIADRPLIQTPPDPGSIVSETSISELGVTEWTLSNGVRVILKPTTFQSDEIRFTAFSPGGHSLVSDADHVSALTAVDVVVESGLGEFTRIDLQNLLAGKAVGVSPWIDALQEGISGGAAPKDIETMFQLIYLSFTAPREDSLAFQTFQSRLRGLIEGFAASPEQAALDTLQVTLAQHHHRARPFTPELLDEMDMQKSLAIYRDRFGDAGDFTFFFVGNFEPAQIQPLVETYLGGLPAAGREETWRDEGIRPPEGIIDKILRIGLEQRSLASIVFTGSFAWSRQNRFELNALEEWLQTKFFQVLRQDLGQTYGVGVSQFSRRFPESTYAVDISFGSAPENVENLTQAIFAQIDSLQNSGPSQEEVDDLREQLRRSRETALEENGFWLNALEFAYYHGEDPLDILTYDTLVDGLTTEAIQQAARRYLNPENYVRVVMHPIGFGLEAKADFNGDGRVNFPDFLLFAQHFDTGQGDPGFDPAFDLNGDGAVDFPDFVQFAHTFGKPAVSSKPVARLKAPGSSRESRRRSLEEIALAQKPDVFGGYPGAHPRQTLPSRRYDLHPDVEAPIVDPTLASDSDRLSPVSRTDPATGTQTTDEAHRAAGADWLLWGAIQSPGRTVVRPGYLYRFLNRRPEESRPTPIPE